MRKINGENTYHSQWNNAIVEIFKDYIFREFEKAQKQATGEVKKALSDLRSKIYLHVSCFPTSFTDGASSCGWPLNVFPPGLQPEDAIMCIINNPNIAEKLYAAAGRKVPQTWGYNELPDYYPEMARIIWGKKVCEYKGHISYEQYCKYIDDGCCVVYAHTGHVVVGKGYDTDKGVVIYNDPFKKANMEEKKDKLPYCVVIFPYPG